MGREININGNSGKVRSIRQAYAKMQPIRLPLGKGEGGDVYRVFSIIMNIHMGASILRWENAHLCIIKRKKNWLIGFERKIRACFSHRMPAVTRPPLLAPFLQRCKPIVESAVPFCDITDLPHPNGSAEANRQQGGDQK